MTFLRSLPGRGAGLTDANRHFARHYGEMLVAMVLGMVALGLPAMAALGAAGVSMSDLHYDVPALMLLGMAVDR